MLALALTRFTAWFRRLALAALLVPGTAVAQTLAATPPTKHADATNAFDPARLSRIDAWLQRLIDAHQIPGAVVMIVRNGRVAYHKAFGVRDVTTGAPLRTDDIFRIASQTKAITTLAVMMLWEEGRFQLDEPIANYLPAFKTQSVLAKFNPADSTYETNRRANERPSANC